MCVIIKNRNCKFNKKMKNLVKAYLYEKGMELTKKKDVLKAMKWYKNNI